MIKDFRLHDEITAEFLLDKCEIATSSAGKKYGRITLSDASGKIDSVMWNNVSQISDLKSGDIVHVQLLVESFNDALQGRIITIAKSAAEDIDLTKLLPSTRFDCNEMLAEVIEYAKGIKDVWLSKLVYKFYSDSEFLKKFRTHPAAVSIHHAYFGGLLQHTLNVTRLATLTARNYDYVNTDLVTTVALLHDIGKLHEIASLPAHAFTANGNLLGHIVEGQNMIRDACASIPDFPDDKRDIVCHCILAHHGELEYGAPVKPAMVEAFIVSACDNIDAKAELFYSATQENKFDDSGFTSKNFYLGTRITTPDTF